MSLETEVTQSNQRFSSERILLSTFIDFPHHCFRILSIGKDFYGVTSYPRTPQLITYCVHDEINRNKVLFTFPTKREVCL